MRSWAREKRQARRAEQVAQLQERLGGEVEPQGATRLFSAREAAFLRLYYQVLSLSELAEAFRDAFGPEKTEAQIRCYLRNHRIRSGRTGHFEPGAQSWNAGTRGQGLTGANVTSFKKGNMPHTKRRLWSERINRDGYVEISIPERNPYTGAPTRFRAKHVWLWEHLNGPVPAGHAVIFADGDWRNFAAENLVLVSRPELLRLNQLQYRQLPAQIKPTAMVLAKVEVKAFNRRKGK